MKKTRIGDGQIYLFESLGSTNQEARKDCYRHGDVIIAMRQTAGYGTKQREWRSPAGNIYMSLILERFADIDTVRTRAAAILVELLGEFGIASDVKWPNDLTVRGKKICGLLTEVVNGGRRLILGIGLNVNMSAKHLSQIGQPATSMAQILNSSQSLEKILEKLCSKISVF